MAPGRKTYQSGLAFQTILQLLGGCSSASFNLKNLKPKCTKVQIFLNADTILYVENSPELTCCVSQNVRNTTKILLYLQISCVRCT